MPKHGGGFNAGQDKTTKNLYRNPDGGGRADNDKEAKSDYETDVYDDDDEPRNPRLPDTG